MCCISPLSQDIREKKKDFTDLASSSHDTLPVTLWQCARVMQPIQFSVVRASMCCEPPFRED